MSALTSLYGSLSGSTSRIVYRSTACARWRTFSTAPSPSAPKAPLGTKWKEANSSRAAHIPTDGPLALLSLPLDATPKEIYTRSLELAALCDENARRTMNGAEKQAAEKRYLALVDAYDELKATYETKRAKGWSRIKRGIAGGVLLVAAGMGHAAWRGRKDAGLYADATVWEIVSDVLWGPPVEERPTLTSVEQLELIRRERVNTIENSNNDIS